MQLDGSCREIQQIMKAVLITYLPLKARKIGLVSCGVSLSSWGGVSLVLIAHASSDDVTVKIPSGKTFFYTDQPCTPVVPNESVKTESESLDQSRLT